MPWPVHPNGLLGAQTGTDTYQVQRSLRFNSARSAYLSRTLSNPTSQSIFTLSMWVKLGALGTARHLFGVSTNHSFGFTTGDALNLTFAGTSALTTTGLFRDPSAWYHIMWTQNVNSHTLYVNGENVGTATATSAAFNTSVQHFIGASNTTTPANYFNGYITEIHFIDGQVVDPFRFVETDALTGRLKARGYFGSYGANGFHLKFADNSGTTSTTLGKDSSPNGSNWTPLNFSVAAGALNDSLVDSPSDYGTDTAEGGEVRGNYAVLNPVSNIRSTIIDGNLRTNAGDRGSISTIAVSSGKWYFEMDITTRGAECSAGVSSGRNVMNTYVGSTSDSFGIKIDSTGSAAIVTNGTTVSAVDPLYTFGNGSTVGISMDLDSNPPLMNFIFDSSGFIYAPGFNISSLTLPIYFAVSGRTTTSANDVSVNFGQRPWAFYPNNQFRGFFKAFCSTNLPVPQVVNAGRAMEVVTYAGTGSQNSILTTGFQPDLVWIKNRSTTTDHAIYDTTRGTIRQLSSNTTGDETSSITGLQSFDVSGFTINTSSLVNTSGSQYVAWCWDESARNGLDIVSYTGSGANRTISHGLGSAPNMIIVKARTTAGVDQGWPVWHSSIANTTYLSLNTTTATTTGADYWNSTSPTSSVFSLGTNAAVNANNDTYIAYLFDEVEGFSRFGSYTGNAAAEGPFVWCGFRPSFIMIKSSTAADAWLIYDSKRSARNVAATNLVPNTNAADATISGIDFLSNGFKLRTVTLTPNAAQTYIFAAFADFPFKYTRAR